MTPVPGAIPAALAALQDVVLPVECAGCGTAGPALCADCAEALVPMPHARTAAGVRVHSALDYEGPVARAIIAFKNEGRTSIGRPLAVALAAAARAAASTAGDERLVLVPMPRTRRSAVERGYDPVRLLLRRARLPHRDLLALGAAPADQLGLSRDDRFTNVAGRMRLRGTPPDASALLVDDVVTTGATLAEAARALLDAGVRVAGAATVASTPRHGEARKGPPGVP